MTAAILSIGTELTRGELINTNAQWLCEKLTACGFTVVEQTTVADISSHIVNALIRLGRQTSTIICTGGLGPTTDDLTREAAAAAIDEELVRDEVSWVNIRARWQKLRQPIPESNLKQAFFPSGARVLSNSFGTAPGFELKIGGSRCFFLPGVPTEMKRMFEEQVIPEIISIAKRTTHQVYIRTFGYTESKIADLLADIDVDSNRYSVGTSKVTIGYRAHFPIIEVKVLAQAETEEAAIKVANRVGDGVRSRLGSVVFGGRDDSFAGYLAQELRKRGLRLAVAESCTGGLIGKLITDVPGSSDCLLLDAVTYSDKAKCTVLGVDPQLISKFGAVSEEVAQAMAEGALRIAGADIAIAVTGIAGPGGGTAEKPVGTVWFGLAATGEPTVTHHKMLIGDRDRVRIRSAYFAMKMVVEAVQVRTRAVVKGDDRFSDWKL